MSNDGETPKIENSTKEANTCIALGAGVGALGAAGTALSGAVCPACLIVAPGLVAIGLYRRWRCRKTPPLSPPKTPEKSAV